MKLFSIINVILAILLLDGCGNSHIEDTTTPYMGLTSQQKHELTEKAISGDIYAELGMIENASNNDDKRSEDFWTIVTLLNSDDPVLLNLLRYRVGWDLLRANQFLNESDAYCAIKLGLTLYKKIDLNNIEPQKYKQYFGDDITDVIIKNKINDAENSLKYIKRQDCSKVDGQSLNAWLYKIRSY